MLIVFLTAYAGYWLGFVSHSWPLTNERWFACFLYAFEWAILWTAFYALLLCPTFG